MKIDKFNCKLILLALLWTVADAHMQSSSCEGSTAENFECDLQYRSQAVPEERSHHSHRKDSNSDLHRNDKKPEPNLKKNHKEFTQQWDYTCKSHKGFAGTCRPIATCFYQYESINEIYDYPCQTIVNGRKVGGACCLDDDEFDNLMNSIYNYTGSPIKLNLPPWPTVKLPIEKADIIDAINHTEKTILSFIQMEDRLLRKGYGKGTNSTFSSMNNEMISHNLKGMRALEVSRYLARKFNLSASQIRDGISQYTLYDTPYEGYCTETPRCNPYAKYRSIDGSCNNLEVPYWGQSYTPFDRFLPPNYSDGLCEIRKSVLGFELPLSRVVSSELTITSSKYDGRLSIMFMQFGQLIDHSLTFAMPTKAANGEDISCCSDYQGESSSKHENDYNNSTYHPACYPILIPPDDPFYSKYNHKCNNFVRNAAGLKFDCKLGFKDQINTVSSFLDASAVYGNDKMRNFIVRQYRNGLLRVSKINNQEWLPYDRNNHSQDCSIPPDMDIGNAERLCVYAGDIRVNQQLGITTLQLLFLREHNRIARELKKLNQQWHDEIIFQETRRIVIAQFQHITFNEWLPLALGKEVMKKMGLNLQLTEYFYKYESKHNPSVWNEFSTAAFRLHTLVQDYYSMFTSKGKFNNQVDMYKTFNNPAFLYVGDAVDQTTYGMMFRESDKSDPIFVDDIKHLLFVEPNAPFGQDLIAIDIQRGRDHGMPTYNEMRKFIGLQPIESFEELDLVFKPGTAKKFAKVYAHVDDIDLFAGGFNELILPEGIFGPTFSYIVASQFYKIRFRDRFWYENGGMNHSFSEHQLNEIRNSSLAAIICANGYHVQRVQPFAMMAETILNEFDDCRNIPQIDLKYWKDESWPI